MKAQVAVVKVHASGSVSGDETVAVETDMVGVDFFTVGLPEDIEEVLVRAAYDIGIFEVFEQCRGEVYRFMGVRLAEIRVVVEDRLALACIVEKFHHPFPKRRVQ